MNPTPLDEWLERAFRLAYFLHGDRDIAVQIAVRALNKLQLAANAQGKRLYYRLTGRADARKARSKVSLSEPHLLQRLVYVESEDYERRKEQAAPLHTSVSIGPETGLRPARNEDIVVYFVKHLVRITTKRNSFYVTLGLSRLLYNYSTPETMELYNLVIQNPDRVHDDYYYRSRKGLLLKELKDRFGALLEIAKGTRGELRWRANEDTERYAALVRECLLWFTPWETPCLVPERFDPRSETINQLHFAGRHPDEEHEVEVNRIHAALHPECFARLVAANGFAAPGERLELPHFFVSDDDDQSGSSRTPPDLSPDDLRAINDLLAQEATRRKTAQASFFRVLVDGDECAEFRAGRSATARFQVTEDNEVVEVYCEDKEGPLLLATYLLDFNEAGPQNSVITVEGGQQISFTTKVLRDEAGATTGADVVVTCKETAGLRSVLTAVRGGLFASISRRGFARTRAVAWWKPVTAFATLALLGLGTWWLWSSRPNGQHQVSVRPTPASTGALPNTPEPSPSVSQFAPPDHKEQPAPVSSPSNVPGKKTTNAPTPLLAESGTKRERDEAFVESSIVPDADLNNGTGTSGAAASRGGGWDREVMGKPLNEVHRVYVQAVRDNSPSQVLLGQMRISLTGSGQLQFSESGEADAALKISARPASAQADDQRVIAIVRVVNSNGYVVWPVSRRGSSMRYVGRPPYVAERIMTDLTKAIVQAQRRPQFTQQP